MAGEKHVILLKTKLHINIFQRFFQHLIPFVYKALGYIIIIFTEQRKRVFLLLWNQKNWIFRSSQNFFLDFIEIRKTEAATRGFL